MGDHSRSGSRSPLKLRKLTLRVLGHDELGQVVGGLRDAVIVKSGHPNGRDLSRNCLG